MLPSEVLGFIGGALTTFGIIPQLVRILRLKSAREISLSFTLMILMGTTCWLTYGVILSLGPVILWNATTLVFYCMLLYVKLKYGRS